MGFRKVLEQFSRTSQDQSGGDQSPARPINGGHQVQSHTRELQESGLLIHRAALGRLLPPRHSAVPPCAEDRVLLTTDAEGMKVYKIITRQTRRPEVGVQACRDQTASSSAHSTRSLAAKATNLPRGTGRRASLVSSCLNKICHFRKRGGAPISS